MRSSATVAQTRDFTIRVVRCKEDHPAWSAPEECDISGIVLVHSGRFRLCSQGRHLTVDPTTGYLQTPGQEHQFSHPAGGDVCTAIVVGEALWHSLAGDDPVHPAVRVDGSLELSHRLLLRTGRDTFAAAEQLVETLTLALRTQRGLPRPGRNGLADRAREAILADHPESTDLVRLARALDVSPAYLSRTFRRHTAMTVSGYRNRVRVSRALARIEAGQTDLAELATDLGFADQAHMARTIQIHVGRPPGHIRRMFTGHHPPTLAAGT